jgi:hypothetical protein
VPVAEVVTVPIEVPDWVVVVVTTAVFVTVSVPETSVLVVVVVVNDVLVFVTVPVDVCNVVVVRVTMTELVVVAPPAPVLPPLPWAGLPPLLVPPLPPEAVVVVWVLVVPELSFGFALFREQAAAKATASHTCLQKGTCFMGISGPRSEGWLRFFVGYFKKARTPDIRSLDCDLGPAKLPTGFRVDRFPHTTRERGQVGSACDGRALALTANPYLQFSNCRPSGPFASWLPPNERCPQQIAAFLAIDALRTYATARRSGPGTLDSLGRTKLRSIQLHAWSPSSSNVRASSCGCVRPSREWPSCRLDG